MAKKTAKRQNVILDFYLHVRFGMRAFRKGHITTKERISPLLNKFMQMYNEGILDEILKDEKRAFKPIYPLHKKHSLVNKKLKDEFEDRAWKNKLLSHPVHSARLLEVLMTMYCEGHLDSLIDYYDS